MKSLTIAVDFDGTCVHGKYPLVGPDMLGAALALQLLVSDGHKLILWTCREHAAYKDVEDVLQLALGWFDTRGIELYAVNDNPDHFAAHNYPKSRKFFADVYIDDHSLFLPRLRGGDLDWYAIYKEIKRIADDQ